jgi:hypothetical protein
MTPVQAEEQPDRPDKDPIEGGGAHRYAVSQEMLFRMRSENALFVRKAEWRRYIKQIESLESHSSNWIAAAWALIGIAASLGGIALSVSSLLLMFGVFAILCGIGAWGCFIADRQVNRGRRNAAQELAKEMEEADLDEVEIIPLRAGEEPPPAATV